ncbi:MAG: BMP family ABC transporter substrate-binding protein [Alphaproteobacteria bacterium]
MKKLLSSLMTIAALSVAALTSTAADKPFKIGVIYPGPIGDFGYSYQHAQGLNAVKEKYGDKVEIVNVESVPEGPESEQILSKLAREGADMIVSTSFSYMNPTVKVAKKFPNIKFEHATGYKRDKNMATYSSRFYEARYISGLIAGHMTKSNEIGYIASFPIPEVIRGINAFKLGLQKTNPDAHINIIWVNSWYDPAKEGEAARTLADKGSDILVQHTDSTAPMQLAEERGLYAFGQATDMIKFGPKAQLSSVVDDWAPYYLKRVEEAMNGTWKTGDVWGGFNTGMVAMAKFNDAIPAEVQAEANAAIKAISDGSFNIFAGPLKNQAGEVVAEEGKALSDEDLLGMNYYIEGIDAKYPD